MEAISKLVSSHKEEVKRRKEEKKRKKEMQEPFFSRMKKWAVSLFFITFYTVFFAAFAYVLVVICTTLIPSTISVILLGLGYSLNTVAELFLGACAGLFFTAWVFTFSFVIIRKVGGVYWRAVKKRIPKKQITGQADGSEDEPVEDVSAQAKKPPIKMKKK